MTPPTSSERARRAALVAAGLALWFLTQSLLGRRDYPDGLIGDGLHALLAGPNAWLDARPRAADALLAASSAVIDLLGLFLIGWSVLGPTLRPFSGLLLLFALRQAAQALCALPPPPGMIWRDPGVPTLLVTYATGNDFFFSGHTAIAVYGGLQLARLGPRWRAIGTAAALFEAATVLVLRAHYTMDVMTGALAALLVDRLVHARAN